ncbi:hypothetical protein SCHPADRAFT_947123 [Schizopora paradoxa]|uniref:Uncharacterized protein n=1 Tax=Schizopora paradoxa TaxID=27342 RepID=A0A0H2R1G5_9AGAM|nr:hypothetical protein SCHPADRAFT_947123 [Schizopora paradoxa]
MVFGLFGKSKAAPPAQDEKNDVRQLRTPSPSASVGTAPPQSPEMLPVDANAATKRSRSMSPSKTVGFAVDDVHLPPMNSEELLVLVKKVPPKTLHEYLLKNLPNASLQEATALTEFFAQLSPPPVLHCVRCHKNFVEVENTDLSCMVHHDDDTAEVMHGGGSRKTTYETLWGCCNKLVEGDGDQGPPDGFCYQGKHTTDLKRARFRADSTPTDDKLISCRRKRCFATPGEESSRARSERSAARKSMAEADTEEEDAEEDFDEKELVREANALTGDPELSHAKGKKKAPSEGTAAPKPGHKKRKSEAMDVEDDDTLSHHEPGPSAPKPKPKSRVQNMRGRTPAKQAVAEIPSVGNEGGGDAAMTDADAMEEAGAMQTDPPDAKPKPKKPRKSRKSAAADGGKYVPPKGEVESSDSDEEDQKPKRKKRKSM